MRLRVQSIQMTTSEYPSSSDEHNGLGLAEKRCVVRRQELIEITELPSSLCEAEAGGGECGASTLAAQGS